MRSKANVNATMNSKAKAAKIKSAQTTAQETEYAVKGCAYAAKASWVQTALLKVARISALERDSAMRELASAGRDSKEKTALNPIKVKTTLSARLDASTNALSNVI